MDKRIIAILKTIALEVNYDYDGSIYCAFDCGGERNYSDVVKRFDVIAHKSTCETMLARALLKEQRILLYGYIITSEAQYLMSKKQGTWQTITEYDKAFSEQEIKDKYATREWVYRRNFKFECVGEI